MFETKYHAEYVFNYVNMKSPSFKYISDLEKYMKEIGIRKFRIITE